MTPLTEKQLEAAARELCRLLGEDPDFQAWHSSKPNWKERLSELWMRDLETIALSVGRESEA